MLPVTANTALEDVDRHIQEQLDDLALLLNAGVGETNKDVIATRDALTALRELRVVLVRHAQEREAEAKRAAW